MTGYVGQSPKEKLKPGTLILVIQNWDQFCMKGEVMMVLKHKTAQVRRSSVGYLTCLVPQLQREKTFNDNYFGSHWVIFDRQGLASELQNDNNFSRSI